jgi:hypothetical protein
MAAATQTTFPAQGHLGGKNTIFVRDVFEGDAAQNDLLFLGSVPYAAILDPIMSVMSTDDLGTSVTMDIGSLASEAALVAAQDVAAAAVTFSLLKSVDIANWGKPLWGMLGLSSNPGGNVDLYAKLEAANPASGSYAWQIAGYLPGA